MLRHYIISFVIFLVFANSIVGKEKAKIQVGSKVPDIALRSIKGDTLRLTDLRGRLVLIDFWASWCAPCRKTNKKYIELYNQYKYTEFKHGMGFEIYSVSLDRVRENWVEATKKDGISWKYNVSDLLMWDSPVAKEFNLKYLPANLLIDGNGKIIELNQDEFSLAKILHRLAKDNTDN